jgi:septal ring factor EnvC (AmiA/AmiB activator)
MHRVVMLVAMGIVSPALTLAIRPASAGAQSTTEERLRNNRDELARIRRERDELQKKMDKLQSSAHSINDELKNVNRQHAVTKRAVTSLDTQLGYITDEVHETTAKLVRAEDEAATKQAILQHRLVEIYKRGPLFALQALLSADSFGELVARYKYLHEIARHDRALVKRVNDLRATIGGKQRQLVSLQNDVQDNRTQKAQEEQRLERLQKQQQQSLARVQADSKKTQERLARVRKSESKLNGIIAAIEAERRKASSRSSAVARGKSSISTSDYGKLNWPVEGDIIYNFGRVVNPDNTTTRWNGIGIEAPSGTSVRSVASGDVVLAAALGTYGQTVIIEHGGGDYSVYGSLARISVSKGDHVTKGQVIGTVGTSDPDLPPHLHFEIRHGGPAVDPATWLRGGH